MKAIAVKLLNKYLGDYVEGFDEKFKVGILSGTVDAHHLRLKKNALDKFGLPVTVEEGYLGHVHLEIPWSSLSSKPVVIRLEDIFIRVRIDKSNPEKRKRDRLVLAEVLGLDKPESEEEKDKKAREKAQQQEIADKMKKEDGFMQQLIIKIVNNVQIVINNLHIRYEDEITDPKHPFAVGFTLEEIRLRSTDEHWNEKEFINMEIANPYKIVKLRNFSLYWDNFKDNSAFLKYSNIEEMANQFRALIKTDKKDPEHQYILSPISGEMKAAYYKDLKTLEKPKINLECKLYSLDLSLDSQQYRSAFRLLDYFSTLYFRDKKRPKRPTQTVRQNPKQWWQFAANCVMANIEKERTKKYGWQWSWHQIKERKINKGLYSDLFKKKVEGKLTPKEIEEIDELEMDKLNYDDIILTRKYVYSVVQERERKEKLKNAKSSSASGDPSEATRTSRFLGWLGFGSKSQTPQPVKEAEKPVPPPMQPPKTASDESDSDDEYYDAAEDVHEMDEDDLWKEIYSAANINSGADDLLRKYPKDYVKTQIDLSIQRVSISLRDEKGKRDNIAVFSLLDANGVAKMREGSFGLLVDLGSLFISDYHTKKGNRFDIVSPNKGAHFHTHGNLSVRGDSEKLARIAIDINPPDEVTPVNVRVEYKSGPLFITFSRALIDRIVDFFDTGAPASQNLVQLAQAANNQLGQLTKAQLRYALEHRKTLKLNIDLDAPMIIIPQDIHDPTSPSLIVDLGHLQMTARPPPPQKEENLMDTVSLVTMSDSELERLDVYFYDVFNLEMTGLNAVVTTREWSDWRAFTVEQQQALEVINNFDVNLTLKLRRKEQEMIPKIKFAGKLPMLSVNVNEGKLQTIFDVIKTVSTPTVAKKKPVEAPKPVNPRLLPVKLNPKKNLANFAQIFSTYIPETKIADDSVTSPRSPSKSPKVASNTNQAEDEETSIKKLVYAKFEISSLVINSFFTKKKATGEVQFLPLIIVTLRQIGMSLDLNNRRMDLQVNLKSFLAEDKMTMNYNELDSSGGESPAEPSLSMNQEISLQRSFDDEVQHDLDQVKPRYIIHSGVEHENEQSQSDVSLISIRFLSIGKTSPEYKGVNNALSIDFTDVLTANMNRLPVAALLQFIFNIVNLITSFTAKPADQQAAVAPKIEAVQVVQAQPTVADPNRPIFFKLDMSMKLLKFNLIKEKSTFLMSSLNNSALNVSVMDDGQVKVGGHLGQVEIKREGRKILMTEGDKIASVLLEMYAKTASYYPGYDMLIDVQLASLKGIFYWVLIDEIVTYFSGFGVMLDILKRSASTTISNAAGSKMKLKVEVSNPFIRVPKNTSLHNYKLYDVHSPEIDAEGYMLLDLGKISIENHFGENTEASVDVMKIDISKLNMKSVHMVRKGGEVSTKERWVLNNTNVGLQLQRILAFKVPDPKLPRLDMILNIEAIKIDLTEEQFALMFGVLSGNFTEKPLIPDKEELQHLITHYPVLQRAVQAEVPKPVVEDNAAFDSKVIHNTHFEVRLANAISFSFYKHDGLYEDGSSAAMMKFAVDDFTTIIDLFSDNIPDENRPYHAPDFEKTKIRIFFNSIVLEDLRENTGMTLKKILNLTYKLPPDDPPISVSLSKQGKVIVRVEFLKPQIFLMPGTLLDFKRFIFPLISDMIVSLNKFTSAGSVVVEQPDESLKDALPMPDPSRSRSIISLIVNDPEIFVVEDPTQAKETMAFALYFQQIFLRVINPDASGKQLLELNFTSTEVVKCVLNMLTLERMNSNNLLSSTKITMHTSADKVQRKTVFDIGHINMIASYMDIKSALDVYKTFEPLITDFTAPAAPKESAIFEFDAQPVANLSDSSDSVSPSPNQSPAARSDIRLGTSRLNLGTVGSPTNAVKPRSTPSTPRGADGEPIIKAEDASHNLSVYIRGINFSFLNDKLYANVIMPVLKANFFQIMVIVLTYPSQKLEVHTQIYRMGIDGYNNKMAFYEPFVEPVSLRFLLNRPQNMPMLINIESADVMNINLTKPFLDILFNTLDTLSNTGEGAENDNQHHIAKSKVDAHRPFLLQPFVVKNQLGTRVNYFSIANELDPQEIDNDEEKPLIVKSRRLGEIFDQQFEYKLSMQFTNTLRETMIIKELNITKVGTNYFQVDSNDLQKRLLCEVTFDKGTKILTIGTNNKIFNHCNHDVDVQVTKLDGSILVIPSLGKGQTRLLPIDCLTFINIKFKPSNTEFEWSEAVKETSLVCRNKKTRVLWNYVFSQQNIRTKNSSKVTHRRTKRKNANDVKKNHTGIYAIVLYPPFILENLLCCEVHFRIQDSSSKEVLMLSSLKKGAFIDICARSAGQSLSMAIKIPGFDWSDAVPFTESQSSTYSRKTFKLFDGFKRPLQLYADMLNTPAFPTCRRLVLYADYWIENRTGLMMYFKDLPYEDNDYASGQNITPKEIVKDYLQQGDPRDWYHNSPGNSLHNSSSNVSNTNTNTNVMSSSSATNYNTHYVELPVLQYFRPTVCFKVGNSGWSNEVNISTKNETGIGEATIKTPRLFKFKINIDNAPGKYSRTKVVKVHPAMILVNKIDEPIFYRQRDFNNYIYQLFPNDEVPIYWFYSSVSTAQRLSISFYKDNASLSSSQKIEDFWSLPFSLDKADFFQLKLKQTSNDPNKKFVIKLINVQVKVLRETTFVVFEKAEEPIYLIDNQTDSTFYVQQKGCKLIEAIEPRKITPYCWEDPQNVAQSSNSNIEPKKLLVAAAGAQKGGMIVELNLDNPSEMPAVPLPGPEKQAARIDIKPNGGPKRVVTIYYSHAKMRRTIPILNETLQVTSELSVSLQGIGISLMSTNFYRDETSDIAGYNSSRRQKEVMYISARGLNFKQYSTNKDVSILECLIGAFQIDNQLVPTKLPVAISSNSTLVWEKGKEFLQLRMQRSPKFNTLDFQCKLNEFELKIDQNFLIQILAFVAFIVTYFSKRSAAVEERKLFEKISQSIRSFHKLTLNDVTSNVFYLENFFINEINTHITFRSEANPDYDHNLEGFEGILRWIPFGLLSAASNLPINLEPFSTKQSFLLQQELITRIVDHYKRWQMYAKQVWNKLDPTVVSKSNPSLNLFMDQVQGVAPEVVGVSPARFPRFFGPDQLLSIYDAEKSEGQYLVSTVNDGQYANTEFYNFHYHVVKNKYIMLATTKLLMFIRRKDGQWYSYWVKELLEGREEKVKIVNVKAHNGKYLTCEKTGGVFANRSAASDWEEWQIEKQPQLGDKVAFRSFHGKYLSSDTFGVMAGKPEAKKWEIWRIIKLQNNPGKIAIESYEQKYMSSENILGINKVSANRSAIKTWEMWESQTIVKLAFVPLSNSYLIREKLLPNKFIVQITAGLENGKPLALDNQGNILKYDRTQWIKHIGQARYITSTQGAFFMLEQKTGYLYQWKNGNWLKKNASHEVDKIYAGSESTLVGVNSKLGKLFKWQNEDWIEVPKGFEGDVNSAGINSNGDLWVATRGGHVFRFQELSGQWTFVLNILAHQVYVAGETVIAVNEGNNNKLYKYNGSNYWDEVAQQTKSCCVSLDGVIYFVDQDGQVLQYRK